MNICRSLRAAALLGVAVAISPTLSFAQIGVQRERNAPSVYAITNARIIPGSGPTVERGTVVLRNGVIAAVGASVQAPADARVIDGTGLTVYPGLIDANSSIGYAAPAAPGRCYTRTRGTRGTRRRSHAAGRSGRRAELVASNRSPAGARRQRSRET